MAKRSLLASSEGIRKAKQAFKRKGWTQEFLASEVGLETRQPIWKFFTGKPVDRYIFNEICLRLELNPEEITSVDSEELEVGEKENVVVFNDNQSQFSKQEEQESLSLLLPFSSNLVETLIQKAREVNGEKIEHQCGSLRFLDVAKPINLDELYVDVNILEEISGKRWLAMGDLQGISPSELETQKRLEALDTVNKYSKIMVLGKPGAGKTTFLQSIAIRCHQGILKADCLPIFVNLKNFAEDVKAGHLISLFDYLLQDFSSYGITTQEFSSILIWGKSIIILDGLDEIPAQQNEKIIHEIRYFVDKFYKNNFIISCRTAAQAYKFSGFTEVEIADFDQQQIQSFVHKWFLSIAEKSPDTAQNLANNFIEELELPKNRSMRELATSPLLLSLTCLVFQFIGHFPVKRSEIYQQGLELLLIRWDEARGIKRDDLYHNLSLSHKIKLLSHIALTSFRKAEYLISESKINQLILEYLHQLSNEIKGIDGLQEDSRKVLKSITTQHGLLVERARGIYSFSHLTFQEYFTAKEVANCNDSQSLQEYVSHIHDKAWREVILLAAEILQPADIFLQLIKEEVDKLLTLNDKVASYLHWVGQKSSQINLPYHPSAIRAFYFTFPLQSESSLALNQTLTVSLDARFTGKLADELALDLALNHAISVSMTMTADIFFNRLPAMSYALDLENLLPQHSDLTESLQRLKQQLPSIRDNKDNLKAWWEEYGESWIEELRLCISNRRQIGRDWEFTSQELKILQLYWDGNKLLLDCLDCAGHLSSDFKKLIKSNLFR
jgi:predicted NACHT family NTPase